MPRGLIDLFLFFPLGFNLVFREAFVMQAVEDFFIFGLFHQIYTRFLEMFFSGSNIFPLPRDVVFGGGQVAPRRSHTSDRKPSLRGVGVHQGGLLSFIIQRGQALKLLGQQPSRAQEPGLRLPALRFSNLPDLLQPELECLHL